MQARKGRNPGGRPRRSVAWILFSRLVVLLTLAGAGLGVLVGMIHLAGRDGPLQERKVVLVERGMASSQIAARLEQEGVISSRHLMMAYLVWQKLLGERRPLKAGEYAFMPGVSVREVLDELRTGKSILHKLTIPEGLSTVQALARIREHPALVGQITVVPDEGVLLPDTYLFTRGKQRDALLRQMMRAQERLLAELWPKRQQGLPLKTPREAVILASIVEKETAVPEERRRIAAVFINRLKKGMRLQADPTVIYGITKGWPLGRPLTKKDLRTETPWNTYIIRGLPPTPIANPGRASIEAVLNPLETDELYFVADGSGRHLFAADLKTHNRNVRKLRAIERERAKDKARQQQQGQQGRKGQQGRQAAPASEEARAGQEQVEEKRP